MKKDDLKKEKIISVSFKINKEYLYTECDEDWSVEKILKFLLSEMVLNEMQMCASEKEIFSEIIKDLKITEE